MAVNLISLRSRPMPPFWSRFCILAPTAADSFCTSEHQSCGRKPLSNWPSCGAKYGHAGPFGIRLWPTVFPSISKISVSRFSLLYTGVSLHWCWICSHLSFPVQEEPWPFKLLLIITITLMDFYSTAGKMLSQLYDRNGQAPFGAVCLRWLISNRRISI